MKSTTIRWRNLQEEEVRPKTDVKGHFVGKQAKPYYFNAHNNEILLLNDALAFKGKGFNPSTSQVDFYFDTPVDITPSKLKFGFLGLTTESNLKIGLNDTSNLVLYSTIKNSNTPVSCSSISFSLNRNSFPSSYEWGLYYCELNGNGVDITSEEIKSLTYKAHCDVINKDLPYHKIELQTLKLYSPYDIQCALFQIGYPSINEYILLGCGYYYLDDYKKQGINQTLKFIDCLSTMTNLYCYSETRYNTLPPLFVGTMSIINWATHYKGSFGLNLTNWRSWLPTYNFQNLNIDNSTFAAAFNRYIPRGNKTCAETLQNIALAHGLTLYVNGENQITMENLKEKSSINESNKLWLMTNPKREELDKVGTLTRQAYKTSQTTDNEVVYQQSSGNVDETAERVIVLEGNCSYSNDVKVNGQSLADINYTFNTIKFTETQNTAIEITRTTHNLTICDMSKTTVFSNSDINYNVVFNISYIYNLTHHHYGIEYAVYWLNRMGNYGKTSINVRLDAKYDVCDIIKNETYGEFVIGDINASYGGGFSGSLSGVARLPYIEAPIITNVYAEGNLDCDIFNPNCEDLRLSLRDNSLDVSHELTIKPFETIHYNSTTEQHDDVNTEVVKYNNGVLFEDVFAQFEIEDDYEGSVIRAYSEKSIILKHNNTEIIEPTFTVIRLEADDDFEIEFENENNFPVNLVVWYDNQTKFQKIRMEAGRILILDDGNFSVLGSDVNEYVSGVGGDSPFCYFESLDGLVRSTATPLFELNYSKPLPPILLYRYVSDGIYGFELFNPNPNTMYLIVEKSSTGLQQTLSISGNGYLLLDETYTWLYSDVLEYVWHELSDDVICYFDDQYEPSNQTILMEENYDE